MDELPENINSDSPIQKPSRWEKVKNLPRRLTRSGETTPIGDLPELQQKSYKGLIFDKASDIQEQVGLEPEIAEQLVGVHLMNYSGLVNKLMDKSEISGPQREETYKNISDYRSRNNLTLKLSREEFANTDFHHPDLKKQNKQTLSDLYTHLDLENVDFADIQTVKRLNEQISNLEGKPIEPLWEIVNERVNQDYEEKKLYDTTEGQSTDIEGGGTNWNVPLREAGEDALENLRGWAESKKVSPETRTLIKDFLRQEGKEFIRTLKPKDHREIAALIARAVADFAPGAGFALMAANSLTIVGKEIRTARRIRKEIEEENLDTSVLKAWFKQTTVGKIYSRETETGLSKEAKFGAGLTGFMTSSAGMMASEATGEAVAVPGAKSIARVAVMRSFFQYFAPRGINLLASWAGDFESEDQKKEWVDLAVQSTSAMTTAWAMGLTGVAAYESGALDTTHITEQAQEIGESAQEAYENIVDQLPPALEGEPVLEGQQSPFAGMVTDTEPPEAATRPTIPPVSSTEQFPEVEAAETPEVDQPTSEQQFESNSSVEYDNEGNPIKATLSNGKELLIAEPADSKGIMGIQHELLKIHRGEWTTDEVAIAAQRLASDGITSDQSEAIANYSKPEIPESLGTPVEEKEINFDSGAKWEVDENDKIVGGIDSNNNRLIFDPQSEGTPGIQLKLANKHPDWTPDEVEVAAYRDGFLGGVDPENAEELDNIEKPEIEPQEKLVDTKNLVKDKGFDEDGDGIEDSHWLKNKETGEIEAGILPDGRTLFLGDGGGITGEVQQLLVSDNPELSPEKVGHVAHEIVTEHNIDSADKVTEVFNQPEIIADTNTTIAQYSLQDYLRDRFHLAYSSAHELAFNKLKLEVRGDSLVKLGPGGKALDFLNARVQTDKGIFTWRDFDWKNWLTEQGVIN